MTVIINGTTGVTSVNGSAAAPSVTGTDTDTGIVYGTNTITLSTNGTAGLVQDASQNVGVGFTPSNWESGAKVIQLSTAGAGGTSGDAFAIWARGNTARFWNNAYYNGSNYVRLVDGVNPSTFTMFEDGSFYWGKVATGAASSTFSSGNITYNMLLNTNGGLQIYNTLGVGNTTPSTSGAGITFPAAQSASSDANTLDDYEEGTFTPTMRGAGTAGTYTGTSSGIYTKIGRQVTVYISFSPSTTASGGTNYMQITGLPFTNANQANGALQMTNVNMSDTAKYWVVQFISSSGQNTIYVSEIYDNSGTTDLSIGGFGTSSSISISLTYFTST